THRKRAVQGGRTRLTTSRTWSAVNTMDYNCSYKCIPEETKRSPCSEENSGNGSAAKSRITYGKEQRRCPRKLLQNGLRLQGIEITVLVHKSDVRMREQ